MQTCSCAHKHIILLALFIVQDKISIIIVDRVVYNLICRLKSKKCYYILFMVNLTKILKITTIIYKNVQFL